MSRDVHGHHNKASCMSCVSAMSRDVCRDSQRERARRAGAHAASSQHHRCAAALRSPHRGRQTMYQPQLVWRVHIALIAFVWGAETQWSNAAIVIISPDSVITTLLTDHACV